MNASLGRKVPRKDTVFAFRASPREGHGFNLDPARIRYAEGLYRAWLVDKMLEADSAWRHGDSAQLKDLLEEARNPGVPFAQFDNFEDALAYCTVCNRNQNGGSAIAVVVQGPIGEDEPLIEAGDFRWAVQDVVDAIDSGFPYVFAF